MEAMLPVARHAQTAEQILVAVTDEAEGAANRATTRSRVRDLLDSAGLTADDDHLELFVEAAWGFALGYRKWLSGQSSEGVLDCYPAWELVDFEKGQAPAGWGERWQANGGKLAPDGRMIALKNDPVWPRLSAFGLPFPPFDLACGLGIEDVDLATAEELGLLQPGQQIERPVANLDFGRALQQRAQAYASPKACRQRWEDEIEEADAAALLEMAEDRIGGGEDNNGERVAEAIFILERALERGFGGNWADQAKAYGFLAEAHDLLHQSTQAATCRSQQIKSLEAWMAQGIPTDGNQRSKVCGQIAQLYEEKGQENQAARYKQLKQASRSGYSFVYEARERAKAAGGMNSQVAVEIIPLLEQALECGFGGVLQDEINACELLVQAYNSLQQPDKAVACRCRQLKALEAWIATGIPTESDRRAKAYRQAATICEEIGQSDQAAAFWTLEEESRDGCTLLAEALLDLKACGKQIEKEIGAQILNKLSKAAQRISQNLSERHAEIYRATGQILDAWGEAAKAVEYYEYALQKNPKIGARRRLDALRRSGRLKRDT